MIVNHLIISNIEDIAKADNLGIKAPEIKRVKKPMILNINDIFNARITKDNNIDLVLTDGFSYEIEYKEEIWSAIILVINAKERRQNSD
jgi:hypothetical protein